jgi:hypothetical protein
VVEVLTELALLFLHDFLLLLERGDAILQALVHRRWVDRRRVRLLF